MIKIAHLYYDLMNLYGDNGNLKALQHQLNQQNIKHKIEFLTINDEIDFSKYDLIYIGPGTDYNQQLILKDLLKYKKNVKQAIEDNKFFLITGNAFDLFGKYILNDNKKKTKTLGIFNFYSVNEPFRLVDEVVVKAKDSNDLILGFQNQRSTMHDLENPMFEIIKGIGSYPNSTSEGLHYNNFYGTYLIGPILARNPKLLKQFTKEIILSKFPNFKFKPFQLSIEQKAHAEYINNYYNSLQK